MKWMITKYFLYQAVRDYIDNGDNHSQMPSQVDLLV